MRLRGSGGQQARRSGLAAFTRDKSGVIAIQTALVFGFVLMPLIALTVDFERVYSLKARLDAAADSAALLGAAVVANELMGQTSNGKTVSASQAILDGTKAASDRFTALQGDIVASATASSVSFSPAISIASGTIQVTISYSAAPSLVFLSYWKNSALRVSSRSTSLLRMNPYVDIQLVLDMSESMNIAATRADIDNLQLLTANGPEPNCAFACHSTSAPANYWQMVQDWNANPASYMQSNPGLPLYPSASIDLRSDVLRRAVSAMIATMRAQVAAGRNRLGIGIFGNENSNTPIWQVQSPSGDAPITGWLNQVFGGYAGVVAISGGGSVPALAASSDFATAATLVAGLSPPFATRHWTSTELNSVIKEVAQAMPSSGTGVDQAHAQKFVFLVTDGVIDWQFSGGRGIGALDPTVCDDLKAKGITVAVLYTEYVRDDSMWSWWPPGPDAVFTPLEPALQACASPNFYFKASTTDISDTLNTMLVAATNGGATLIH